MRKTIAILSFALSIMIFVSCGIEGSLNLRYGGIAMCCLGIGLGMLALELKAR